MTLRRFVSWSYLLVLSYALLLGCAMFLGCATVRSAPALPNDLSVVRDQLVIYSDFKLASRHRLVEELLALRGDIAGELDIPVSNEPIHVYLFEKRETYQGYIGKHFPDLPYRRAFFVESDTRLTVYAHWGERVAEDLRHEVTHGYLHAVIPNLPLWIDEGLAEYFETPRGWDGLHPTHIELLDRRAEQNGWRPDLERLNNLTGLEQMSQIDYAESWLWIHFLLQSTRERRLLLQHYLGVLREKAQAPPFSVSVAMAESDSNAAVLAHLRALATNLEVE